MTSGSAAVLGVPGPRWALSPSTREPTAPPASGCRRDHRLFSPRNPTVSKRTRLSPSSKRNRRTQRPRRDKASSTGVQDREGDLVRHPERSRGSVTRTGGFRSFGGEWRDAGEQNSGQNSPQSTPESLKLLTGRALPQTMSTKDTWVEDQRERRK